MEVKTIAVTGAHGQVGNELQAIQDDYPGFSFLFLSREDLDITDEAAVQLFFEQHRIQALINGAAYTAVDRAEDDIEKAYLVNEKAVGFLTNACKLQEIPFVHYSSDYVYHLPADRPWKETDLTSPKGVYAASKLAGDQLALNYQKALVLRTSWVYSAFGKNFVKTMLRLGKERPNLSVVFDQIGTPTYARDLAKASLDILRIVLNQPDHSAHFGLFHFSNEGVCSWYDFAVRIFEMCGITCDLSPIESSQYPTPAARPSFSVLNKSKIKSTFGIEINHWSESLENCLRELEEIE